MAPTPQQLDFLLKQRKETGKRTKARIDRYLKNATSSHLNERPKSLLLLKGTHCSNFMNNILKDLKSLQAPNSKYLMKKNVIYPFNDTGRQSIEFLLMKNDCCFLAMGSHSKKRPNNLVLARTFDRIILDMVELGITNYVSSHERNSHKKRIGSKPILLFDGDWSVHPMYVRLQNILTDIFTGESVKQIDRAGLDHVISWTIVSCNDNNNLHKLYMRTYHLQYVKDHKCKPVPKGYLIPTGPDIDCYVRRTDLATEEVFKKACKQPKELKQKKKKNKTTNMFGETIGRLHIGKQDVMGIKGKKVKALQLGDKNEKRHDDSHSIKIPDLGNEENIKLYDQHNDFNMKT